MPCTDERTGRLIGSYELGLLSKQERKSFEAHVLKCDHCFQDLYRTAPVVSAMKTGGAATVPAGAGPRRELGIPRVDIPSRPVQEVVKPLRYTFCRGVIRPGVWRQCTRHEGAAHKAGAHHHHQSGSLHSPGYARL